MFPPTPTEHYLVWIRLQQKISYVASFAFSKWLKKYYFIAVAFSKWLKKYYFIAIAEVCFLNMHLKSFAIERFNFDLPYEIWWSVGFHDKNTKDLSLNPTFIQLKINILVVFHYVSKIIPPLQNIQSVVSFHVCLCLELLIYASKLFNKMPFWIKTF